MVKSVTKVRPQHIHRAGSKSRALSLDNLLGISRAALYALLPLVGLAIGVVPFAKIVFTQATSPLKIMVFSILIAVAAAGWVIALLTHRTRLRLIPLWQVWACLAVLVTGSALFALDSTIGVFGEERASHGLLTLYSFLLMVFLTVQLIDTPKHLVVLARSVSIGSMLIAVLALLQVSGFDPIWTNTVPWVVHQGYSTLGNPDFLGMFLIMPTVLALGFAVVDQSLWRMVHVSAAILSGASLVFSLTRAAWLGVCVGVLVLIVLMYMTSARSSAMFQRVFRLRLALVVGGVILVVTGCVIVSAYNTSGDLIRAKVAKTFSAEEKGGAALGGRIAIWSDAVTIIAARPLLGSGPDNFGAAWYQIPSTNGIKSLGVLGKSTDPHSYPLFLAASLGIPAALIFYGLLLGVLVKIVSSARLFTIGLTKGGSKDPQEPAKDKVAVLLASEGAAPVLIWASAVIAATVGSTASATTFAIGCSLWLGLGVLYSSVAPARTDVKPSTRGFTVIGVVAITTIVFVWSVLSGISAVVQYAPSDTVFESRLSAAQQAQKIAPWRDEPRQIQARLLVSASNTSQGADRVNLAQRVLDENIRFAPNEYVSYWNAAQFAQSRGAAASEVLNYVNKGLAVYPNGADLWSIKGVLAYNAGDVKNAGVYLTRAYRLEQLAPVHLGQVGSGYAYVQYLNALGQSTKALAITRQLRMISPNHVELKAFEQTLR